MPTTPVLVGQRIKAVRRMTVAEQNLLDLTPSRQRGIIIELDSGALLFVDDDTSTLGVRTADGTFAVNPSSVEVVG